MRIARVLGKLTLGERLEEFPVGSLLLCEALDREALKQADRWVPRQRPMPESLVVFDQLGAGEGDLVGVSEGREAAMPFSPERVPLDAYCAAILDTVRYE